MKKFIDENSKLVFKFFGLIFLGLLGAYTPIDKSIIFIGVLMLILW